MLTIVSKNRREGPIQTGSRGVGDSCDWQSLIVYVALLGGWMAGLMAMKPVHTWIHLLFILANLKLISRILNSARYRPNE